MTVAAGPARRRDDGRVRSAPPRTRTTAAPASRARRSPGRSAFRPSAHGCPTPATTSASRRRAASTSSSSPRARPTATWRSCLRARRATAAPQSSSSRPPPAATTSPPFPGSARSPRCRRAASRSGSARSLAARSLRLVLHGADKRHAARRLLSLDRFDPDWPASIVHDHDDAIIYIDEEAAA